MHYCSKCWEYKMECSPLDKTINSTTTEICWRSQRRKPEEHSETLAWRGHSRTLVVTRTRPSTVGKEFSRPRPHRGALGWGRRNNSLLRVWPLEVVPHFSRRPWSPALGQHWLHFGSGVGCWLAWRHGVQMGMCCEYGWSWRKDMERNTSIHVYYLCMTTTHCTHRWNS